MGTLQKRRSLRFGIRMAAMVRRRFVHRQDDAEWCRVCCNRGVGSMIKLARVIGIVAWASMAHSETPNEWFLLAVEIQNHNYQLDAEERMFIRNVINRLTV